MCGRVMISVMIRSHSGWLWKDPNECQTEQRSPERCVCLHQRATSNGDDDDGQEKQKDESKSVFSQYVFASD
ncbi:hypothetical protein BaRGS_00025546 [Batillaria attramentaria]|uniref:Uncharacterized protein n=1 Tax=Batillaria attramentaria TaxID=370345 RepID=A0ABD0K861_9CAEN